MKPETGAVVAVLSGAAVWGLGTFTQQTALPSVGLAAAVAGLASLRQSGAWLRIMGALMTMLGVLAAVLSGMAGGWNWVGVVPALALIAMGAGALRHRQVPTGGPPPQGLRQQPNDPWKQLDAGDDPTQTR